MSAFVGLFVTHLPLKGNTTSFGCDNTFFVFVIIQVPGYIRTYEKYKDERYRFVLYLVVHLKLDSKIQKGSRVEHALYLVVI